MERATQYELQLARRMSRLGTETAFEVLNKARALERQGKKHHSPGNRRARLRYALQCGRGRRGRAAQRLDALRAFGRIAGAARKPSPNTSAAPAA